MDELNTNINSQTDIYTQVNGLLGIDRVGMVMEGGTLSERGGTSLPACKWWRMMNGFPCRGYASKHKDVRDESDKKLWQIVMGNFMEMDRTTGW